MAPRIRWARGGEAQIVSISANGIVLRSNVPAPPGSRLEGTVERDGGAFALRIKVHASKRVAEEEFLLQARPLDLAREVRLYLERAIAEAASAEQKRPHRRTAPLT
jgi:hypothetical protein